MRRPPFHGRLWLAGLAFALLSALPAAAQNTPANAPPSRPTPDFFFSEPKGSVALRGGWVFARAGSDIYDFVAEHLTVEKSDFNAPSVGFDVGVIVSPRVEIVGSLDFHKNEKPSNYRAFVDNFDQEIEQATELKETALTASVRYSLADRGRGISRFAWIPRGVTPYVGGGGGVIYYKFYQAGDFVDFVDSSIFTDVFQSSGWAPSAHLFGGADFHVWRRMYLSGEARYVWAAGKLSQDFVDFDPIDLTGFHLLGGINVKF